MFSEREVRYRCEQRLARIATVSADLQPDVSPVGFQFDGQHFYVGGRLLEKTYKYRNVLAGRRKVALVIDDLASVDPWQPRGIKVYGQAEIIEQPGPAGPTRLLKITPTVYWSWGIEAPAFAEGKPVPKKKVVLSR